MPDIADIRRDFVTLAAREPIPLARGALLIAQEEYPQLDLDGYMDKIATLAREAELVVKVGNDTIEKIQLLSHFLFEQKGFEGNREEYADPRNSFLNEVIDRRRGIPITLSVLYIEVGRRLGLNLYGVGFPTHFLVKAVDERGELIIDPFYEGAILTLEEIRARLTQVYGQPVEVSPAHLKPVGTRHILVRMLRNLKAVYLKGWRLDARAIGARSHPAARPALTRRADGARRAVREPRMLQGRARRLPEFSLAGARPHRFGNRARGHAAAVAPGRSDQLSRNPGLSGGSS